MKQDRFLIGILIGIAVLIIAALVVFFIRKDNLNYSDAVSPEAVVQNYVVALHKREFDKAYGYLADLPGKPSADDFRQAILNHEIDPTSVGLEIGKTEISADSATVSLGIIYSPNDPFSSGNRNSDFAQLIQQQGIWKLKQLPANNFWSYNWYQPLNPTAIPVK